MQTLRALHHESIVPNLRNGVRFYLSDEPFNNYVPMHWHNSIEVVCLIEGDLRFTIDGKVLRVRPGEFAMVRSGAIHDVASVPNRSYVLQAPLRAITPFCPDADKAFFLNGQTHRPEYAQMAAFFGMMYDVIAHPTPKSSFDFEIYLLSILKTMFTTFRVAGTTTSSADSAKEIIAYVNEHADEAIVVGEIADVFGYNPSYLSRMFKKQTGISLVRYAYEVKVNRLHDDLLNTSESVSTLMERHGLSNLRLAREVFREKYGMLPKDIRRFMP